ncbi:putative bifunctional diguanylate cyclase/phosphodiesterase [Sphingomonas cavernae]|uniref:EAL domain-containing protein n=1 Tax=Sphingomonas cavernae TaxID=2320861 RepID=A0A418WM07_9SPHN|nr:EAL domain-containing protein [Sphingomonas cavernae]RJF91029.1 EAL domain-containing protein [Sphingomonas cavernae]
MAEAHETGAVRRRGSAVVSARRDLITGSVTVAAIVLFAGTGGSVIGDTVKAISGVGGGADRTLVIALLLNIALILFGWRRYSDLSREVKERSAAEERARELASKDPLTGFLNRRSLAEMGAAMLARANRRQKCVAMLMLDLDNFKNVNDMHGHAAGDALLKAVATEIEKAMPPVALAARLGGDEFACAFLFDPSSPEAVNRVAQKIVSRLSQPFDAGGIHTHISVSVGIARSETDCDTIEALMRRADIAMYAAKNSGRNRHCWFDSSMERALQIRNAIEAGLRSGIPKGEFVPYYEQQIDLTTGRLHGFEVLARWDSPTQGLVSPDQFVPVAEETGMIGDLSMSVIRQAMEHGRDWDPSLTLSVNISPGQLKDPWLAQKLVKLLVETGYPAQRLEVEITESSLFENLVLAQSIVGSLKNQGIKLALDDFGTGYSSLAHLRALPFDRIKIDRSFVSSINDNPESAAIVNAITRLGDSLGLPVTAEGIEDAEIEQRLRVLGVHKGQGWHFGKPMPVSQVRKLLADKNLLPAARQRSETSKSASVRTFRQAG